MTPEEFNKWVEEDSKKEQIYDEPKWGGKDHSGYDTIMKYEINYDRSEAAENCARRLYALLSQQLKEKDEEIAEWKKGSDINWKSIKERSDLKDKTIDAQRQEIERLKGLCIKVYREFTDPEMMEQFKKDNQL